MSQRTQKVAQVVRQAVAAELAQLPAGAYLTITNVDVTPDLRGCTIWVGVSAPHGQDPEALFQQALGKTAGELRRRLQRLVAARLTTKFVPRLSFRYDTGGAYADRIGRLLDNL